METADDLLTNLDKLHTTDLGAERIKRNLKLTANDVICRCKNAILAKGATIERKGKNWYVTSGDAIITVNAYSYTVITAHKIK